MTDVKKYEKVDVIEGFILVKDGKALSYGGWKYETTLDNIHPNTVQIYKCSLFRYECIHGPLEKGVAWTPVKITTTMQVEVGE
jgi:hypothetical protein